MARLNPEEKGLLHALERVERGECEMNPSALFELARRGLVEGEPPVLSSLGERVLEEFRLRSVRATGEFPAFALAVGFTNGKH